MALFNYNNLSGYKKLILKEVSVQFFEKLTRVFVGLFVVRSLSLYLGPDDFGALNFIESYYLMLYGIAIFGLDTVITKKFVLTKTKENFNDLISAGVIILITISSLLYLFNFLFLINFIEFEQEKLILIICFLLFLNPFLLIEYFLTSKNQIRYISAVRLVAYLISSSLKITAVYLQLEIDFFIYTIMFEGIMLYLGLIFLVRNKIKFYKLPTKFNFQIINEMVKDGFPIFLYAIGALIYSRIDILMIQRYLSENDLGNYSASLKLVTFLLFLPGILSASFFPKIVSESSFSNNSSYIRKMYRYSFFTSFIILIICLFSGPIMIDILFGDKFESALIIFYILIFILMISSISAVYTKVIYSVNLQHRLLLRSVLGIVINIILNYYLIQLYGVYGSAIATIISLFFIEILYDFFDPKLRSLHIFKLRSIMNMN